MIKKIYILIIAAILIYSCGKKGDPVYKEGNHKLEKINTQMSVFS